MLERMKRRVSRISNTVVGTACVDEEGLPCRAIRGASAQTIATRFTRDHPRYVVLRLVAVRDG